MTATSLSPGMTSSITAFERGRPMLSGMTVPGKTTRLRIGNNGIVFGTVVCWPARPDLMTVCVSVREMIWGSDMVLGGQ